MLKRTASLAVLPAVLLFAVTLSACAVAATDHAQQRALFKTLYSAAKQGRLQQDDPRLDRLQGYPLYNYVIAANLRYRLDTAPNAALDTRIAALIDENPDLPPARRLRNAWLKSLTERARWQLVLAYTEPEDSTANRCRAVHAAIATGQQPRAQALDLWRVGRSQPQACDPVFAWLEHSGLLTADEILGRAKLSYLAGQYGMVRYLASKLPDHLAARTERWLGVVQSPSRLRDARALPDEVLAHAFRRYALRNVDSAALIYAQLVARMDPGAQARYEMQSVIALLFAQSQDARALTWFDRLDRDRMDDHVRGWEVRAAIWQRQWATVIDRIRAMPASQRDEEEWRYWLGRALLARGAHEQAEHILAPLAAERSYHGYLAADQLGVAYSFNIHPLPQAPQARQYVLSRPALQRASELDILGRDWQIGAEWRVLTAQLNQAQLREAARIASQRGWMARAIITLARSDYWDDLDIRYPTPYIDDIRLATMATGLEPAYVLAIMRTESLFQPTIVSPAGAVGLMQLMPGTARLVARRNNLSRPSASALRRPATNIDLGTRYLQHVRARFGGNPALAAAAYNAGPNKVEQWLPAESGVAPDIWIANISYTETRKYVQNVLSHMMVFEQRLSGTVRPLKQLLAPVQASYGDITT